MSSVFVSVGSNIDRAKNIRSSIVSLRQHFGSLQLSSVYDSAAEGFDGEPFYNLVVGFQAQDVHQVNAILHHIENEHGRERVKVSDKNKHAAKAASFNNRTLDLDLLVFGGLILNETGLRIPRDEIVRYAFVLGPLAEIAPDFMHPQLNKSFNQLWSSFREASQTRAASIFPVDFKW